MAAPVKEVQSAMSFAKWWKKIALSALSAGSGLVIAACYGAYYGVEQVVGGRVSHQGNGIPDIEVCARVASYSPECRHTGYDGHYYIEADGFIAGEANANGFQVRVRDVDGAVNGEYEDELVDVDPGRVPAEVDVELTERSQ